MSTQKQVNVFIRVTLTPVSGGTTLWQASTRTLADPPSYWDGKKRGLIESIDDVERALSDNRGAYEVPSFGFTVNDKDGYWRGLLASPDTQYLTSSDVMYLLVSEDGRHTGATPRTEFRGQLEAPAALTNRKFKVGAQSRLGTRYGPVDLQTPANKAVYSADDWPDMPRENEGKTVPALWGEESDAGVTNADDEEVAVGRVTPTLLGKVFQGSTAGTPPTGPSFLPDPPPPTYTRYGSGGSTTWSYAVSVRTVNGHTKLGPAVEIANLPSAGNFTNSDSGGSWRALPSNGVALHLAVYEALLQAQVTGVDLWVKQGPAAGSGAWHLMDGAGEIFNTTDNEYFNGNTGYMDNGDDSHFKPSPAPPATNTAQVTPGTPGTAPQSIFYDFWCLLRFPGKITKIHKSNLAEQAEYVAVSASEIGTDYTSGKHFLLGPDGEGVTIVRNGKTFFGFLAKGEASEAAKQGQMPFRVNLCGRHQDDDTANPIIDQAARVFIDIFCQLGGNNGDGYGTAQLPIPTFATAPMDPVLQSTTFEAVQDITKLYMGDDKGYVACVYIDDDRSWGDVIQQMCGDFQFDLGESARGQLILKVMSDMTLPTDGIELRAKTHIKEVEDAGSVADDEVENDTDYVYDHHPINNKFMSGVKNIHNDLSIAQYGRRKGPQRELLYIRDPPTAVDTTRRYHLHRIVAPIYVTVPCKTKRATNVELGDQVRFQHTDFVTPEVAVYVQRRRFSQANRQVTLKGRVRTSDTFASQWAPDDTTGTNYADATAEERAKYWFWTNDDGTLPDGSIGSRWR